MKKNIETLVEHRRIIWALILRELATRYGRDNLGFLWVVGEPAAFCIGVMVVFSAIRGRYENGLEIIPFLMTGYLPTVLVRHIVMYSLNAIKINNPLLYHRHISVLDLFLARIATEFIGVTLAFFIIYTASMVFGFTHLPADLGLMLLGWFLVAFAGVGFALILGAISELFEVVERIVGVAMYLLVPLSGTFYIVQWLPTYVQKYALMIPFLDGTEMIRGGYFGSEITPHYDIGYTLMSSAVMTVIGLLLVRGVRHRVEVY